MTLHRHSFHVAVLGLLFPAALLFAQTPQQEQEAQNIINSARQLLSQRSYPQAAARFREYLQRFPKHKEAAVARITLAQLLIDGPEKNYKEAAELVRDFPADNPLLAFEAHYNHALAQRGLALADLLAAKPGKDGAELRAQAVQRFKLIAAALGLTRKQLDLLGESLPGADEWKARVLCDQAEAYLRGEQPNEAREATRGFLAGFEKSKYRSLGRYYHAHAAFVLGDHAAAEKILTMLAPYADPEWGPHARYLLARIHHVADERAEALLHYDAALRDFGMHRTNTINQLKQPQTFNNDPLIKAKLEARMRGAIPEYIALATFHHGVLLYEAGRFGEAKMRFADFQKSLGESPLRAEAELRLGMAQVALKEYAEAIKTLAPLAEKLPAEKARVALWLGRAYVGMASPTKPAEYQQALQRGIDALQQAVAQAAADKALADDAQFDLADTLQVAGKFKEASQIYGALAATERGEEAVARLVQALHAAGDLDESDRRCLAFQQAHPRSLLLPAVVYTFADNAAARWAQIEKSPAAPQRGLQLKTWQDESVKRFLVALDRFPEYPRAQALRFLLGVAHYRQDKFNDALKVFGDIPAPERGGELALVPYLMADCILRQTATTIDDDALAAGKLQQELKAALELLESFVASNAKAAETPDALLKIGLCQQRLAQLHAQPQDKQRALAAARAAYDRISKEAPPNHDARPTAIFERAKVVALQGDLGQAMNEYARFTREPLNTAKIAPLAHIQLAAIYRMQTRGKDAADLLAKAREKYEPSLAASPEGTEIVPLLRYHHGLALRDANNFKEALELFDSVKQKWPTRPEAVEAALRAGQCQRDEALKRIEDAQKRAGSPKKEEQAKALADMEEGYKAVSASIDFLAKEAQRDKETFLDTRARMLYEAAWCARLLAEREIRDARAERANEIVKTLGPAAGKFPLDVPLATLPVQPSEKRVREMYEGLIEHFGDTAVSIDARYELAELLAQRHEHDKAAALLSDVLDKEPAPEVTEKVRLLMGVLHAERKNYKGAMTQFEAVLRNVKSPHWPQAQYRAGEVHMEMKEYPEAIKRFMVFREQDPYKTVPNVSDRAVLRCGQALAALGRWDESKLMMERVLTKYPGSSWTDEARFGIGMALEKQRNFDAAVQSYQPVALRTTWEVAARAQLQIGRCLKEQKKHAEAAKALLAVALNYPYPDLSAAALLEAAQVYEVQNQRDQAEMVLRKVIADYPGTMFAETARIRLKKK
jgi:TolA-binding protein